MKLLNCYVVVDYVQIACTMPAGRGTGFAVTISVLNQVSAPSAAALAYAPPNITHITSSPTAWTSDGGAIVTIAGANFGVGQLLLYVCQSNVSITGSCVQLPPVSAITDGLPVTTSSPPLGANLAGAAVLWLYVIAVGQTSPPRSVSVAAPNVIEITAMNYAALFAATSLDSGTQGCYTLVKAQPLPTTWSVLSIEGQNLGIAAAMDVPVVSIAPSNAADNIPCQVCSLTSTIALCIANTSSSYTRNGVLTYTLGAFVVATNLLLDVTLPPRLLSLARDSQPGVVALPGTTSPGPSAGCALLLQFDKAATPVSVGTKAAIDNLLSFSEVVGTNYTGAWVSPSLLRITITAGPTTIPPGIAVGFLRVNVSASAGLKAATGISIASSASGVLEAGSWGDAVQAIAVAVRTSTQLYVTMTAPSLVGYPSRQTTYTVDSYVVTWGRSPAAMGLGMMAVNLTAPAATSSVTISSLTTGLPVSVRVSATVRVVAGTTELLCAGPFVSGASPVTPVAPVLTGIAVAAGRPMGTRGGDEILLSGSALGLFAGDISASYSNGNISLVGTNCRVTVPGSVVTCSSAVGAGAGFIWRINVGAASALSPSTTPLSYELPIISDFFGAGAVHAVTQGGQQVNITGDQFGPAGSAYITTVQ
jgi:hypothetical protein